MSENEAKQITFKTVMEDLFTLPFLFAALVSAPSMLSILQVVIIDHQLVPALQWIVDGYNGCMQVIGAVVDPPVLALCHRLGDVTGIHLEPGPLWKQLAIVFLALYSVVIRYMLRSSEKYYKKALQILIIFAVFIFQTISTSNESGLNQSNGHGPNVWIYFVAYFATIFAFLSFYLFHAVRIGDVKGVRSVLQSCGGLFLATAILLANWGLKALAS